MGSVAVAPSESYVIFALVSGNPTVAGNRGDNKVYESDDGGNAWNLLGNPNPQGRGSFVETNPRSDRANGAFDLWVGDVSLYRANGVKRNAADTGTRRVDPVGSWTSVQGTVHADGGALLFSGGGRVL